MKLRLEFWLNLEVIEDDFHHHLHRMKMMRKKKSSAVAAADGLQRPLERERAGAADDDGEVSKVSWVLDHSFRKDSYPGGGAEEHYERRHQIQVPFQRYPIC